MTLEHAPAIDPQSQSEDDLLFMDESTTSSDKDDHFHSAAANTWNIMIIDDDKDVHSATTFALNNLEVQHRKLAFSHAYSAAEARELLKTEQDVAVILLDVVMESEDAGLQLVRHIREILRMTEVRIVLRTGQPGYAPEIDAIRDFDINDYKTKSELTRIKLFTAITTALRSYEQIRAINASRRGLDMIVHASTELMAQHGLENFAAGIITQLSGLLSLKPEGLLCIQEDIIRGDVSNNNPDDKHSNLLIIAAAGIYQNLIHKPITTIADRRIIDALEQALHERRNVYGPNYTALYFTGNALRDFAAFLDTGAEINDIDKSLLEVFCSNISVGLDNVELVSRLRDFAFYDSLTKLPNRIRLVEILNEIREKQTTDDITLALVDIDHFSETNDTLGHQFGDLLLLAVASRLQSNLGEQVHVARVSGDVFAVVGNSAQVAPANIAAQFEKSFDIDGQNVQLSSTLGLVRLQEYEGSGGDALKDADIALKHAKDGQRSGYFYFSNNMGVDIRERVHMMHALRNAVEAHHIFVVYQPQIDLKTRRATGAEALVRWKKEDNTFVPPDRFIPIAEYSGIIIELGEYVMRESCRELVRLRNLGFNDFKMSINVSQAQFRHPQFMETLRSALQDTQAPPEFVELEITESMAMEEPDTLIKLLGQIKQIGVSIAIDDFGTGFSSLSFLQRLQIDKLKIDRAFVTEITNSTRGSSIAEMVVQLGHNLGLQVIAEGVEDEQQAGILSTIGCQLGQGYLFAKPLTSDLLVDWLNKNGLGNDNKN